MSRRIDAPVAGFYRTRLINGGIRVAVRFWFGSPIIDGEEQDRSPRWCVEVDGCTDRADYDAEGNYLGRVPLDAHETWPYCEPIDAREYQFLLRRREWAHDNDPAHPAANPRTPINVRDLKPGW